MFPKDGGFIASTHRILINEFIPAFYLVHGLYTTDHKVPKAISKIVDGKVKIDMTKRAKEFWEGSEVPTRQCGGGQGGGGAGRSGGVTIGGLLIR